MIKKRECREVKKEEEKKIKQIYSFISWNHKTETELN